MQLRVHQYAIKKFKHAFSELIVFEELSESDNTSVDVVFFCCVKWVRVMSMATISAVNTVVWFVRQ